MSLSRRSLVTSAAALPALAVLAIASTEPDPIFAAIERHRSAYSEWSAAVEVWSLLLSDDPRYPAAELATEEKSSLKADAVDDLVTIYPTTAGGVVALLKYYSEHASLDNGTYWPDFLDDETFDRDEGYGATLAHHAARALERIIRSEA